MYDIEGDENNFFDKLCRDQRYIDLGNAGYKCWELFPENHTLTA